MSLDGCFDGVYRVFIYQAESAELLQQLGLPNIVEINFSPRGTYISTWERPGEHAAAPRFILVADVP